MSNPNSSTSSTSSTSLSERGAGGIVNLFSSDQVVTIHVPQDPAENLPLISTCFYYMERENEPFQAAAYFSSILICFLPGFINHVRDAFTDLGVTATMVTTASARQISMKPPFTVSESLVLLGQAVIVLYKNPQSDTRYDNFMKQRINTLRAHSRVPSCASADSIKRISFAKAKDIRSILGSSSVSASLKKSLLQILLQASQGTSRSNVLCSYLCDALAWSGMEAIVYIYHTLWNPRSKALKRPSLKGEVKNLEEAFKKITAAAHPKHFKILNPPDETRLIEMHRFPTIVELAKLIISSRNLVASPRLIRLKKIHDKGVKNQSQVSAPSQAMQCNTEIASEFVEQVMAYGRYKDI